MAAPLSSSSLSNTCNMNVNLNSEFQLSALTVDTVRQAASSVIQNQSLNQVATSIGTLSIDPATSHQRETNAFREFCLTHVKAFLSSLKERDTNFWNLVSKERSFTCSIEICFDDTDVEKFDKQEQEEFIKTSKNFLQKVHGGELVLPSPQITKTSKPMQISEVGTQPFSDFINRISETFQKMLNEKNAVSRIVSICKVRSIIEPYAVYPIAMHQLYRPEGITYFLTTRPQIDFQNSP